MTNKIKLSIMKKEWTIEQIRDFVKKDYQSVSARMTKCMLYYYDEFLPVREPDAPDAPDESPSGETLEAVEFAEWVAKYYYPEFNSINGFRYMWTKRSQSGGNVYSGEQLYNLFLQQTGKPSVVVHEIITSPADYDRILEGKNKEIVVIAEQLEGAITDYNYWRQRCEAAEAFIEFSPIEPDINGLQIAAHKRWLELKSKSLTP